jgi:hypothetical protein
MKILIITTGMECLEIATYLLDIGSSITLAKEEELVWLDLDDYDHIFRNPSLDEIIGVLK